jgi:hypothetical protein
MVAVPVVVAVLDGVYVLLGVLVLDGVEVGTDVRVIEQPFVKVNVMPKEVDGTSPGQLPSATPKSTLTLRPVPPLANRSMACGAPERDQVAGEEDAFRSGN